MDVGMKRLTFGVKLSPFLATQVLRQMALDHKADYPRAAEIVNTQFYVDDCLTGSNPGAVQLVQGRRNDTLQDAH